jgi:energy-coupling factor transporter ATP-binding protein EcfA2
MSIEKNALCAILGHNGAGKSTLIKTLIGIHPSSRLGPNRIRTCSWGPRNVYYCESLWKIFLDGPVCMGPDGPR